jgi:hypothetical protein
MSESSSSVCARVRCSGASECTFLDREVGVQVDLGCACRLMPQPERDHGGVDAGVEQPHCTGVPERVRRELLAFQGRARAFRDRTVLGEQTLDGVAAELPAAAA